MKSKVVIAALCLLYLKTAHGQCGDGWVFRVSSCYHISHDREEWANAEYMCHKMGGYLAEVNNADEGHFLEKQVKLFNFSEGQTWIGATDILVEGDWVWAYSQISLSSRAYTNWLAGEPNNLEGNENCLSLFNTGLWNDEDCDTHFHYICEKEPVHDTAQEFSETSGVQVDRKQHLELLPENIREHGEGQYDGSPSPSPVFKDDAYCACFNERYCAFWSYQCQTLPRCSLSHKCRDLCDKFDPYICCTSPIVTWS